jgi:quercetin dioxygenase-like cupin family protein
MNDILEPISREKIQALEDKIAQCPQLVIEPVHYFADGLYAREITIPEGAVLTGRVHKFEHLNIVSKGTITVWTEGGMRTVSAPFTMVSKPGTKRVGLALTETVWTTVHALPNDIRDIEAVEARIAEPPIYRIVEAGKPCVEEPPCPLLQP